MEDLKRYLDGWQQSIEILSKNVEKVNEAIEDASNKMNEVEKRLIKEINDLKIESAKMRVELTLKSGIWGLLGGIATTIGAILWLFFSKH